MSTTKTEKAIWIIAGLLALVILGSGCKAKDHAKRADELFDQQARILAAIDGWAQQAADSNAQADRHNRAAATQPGNPPQTNLFIGMEHDAHVRTAELLGKIPPATREGTVVAEQSANETREAVAETAKLKNSWSYKVGHLIVVGLAWIVGGWLVASIGAMLLRGFGGAGLGYVAEHVLDFLPFSNPFYAASDRIKAERRKEA